MLRKISSLPLVVGILLVGCGLAAPALAPVKKSGMIRVGFPTAPDAADVPSLMAHDLLRADGYTVEQTFFENPDLEVAALASSDLDFSNGSTRTHWAAAQKGADIITLMQQSADEWSLVARADVKTCDALHGKRMGVQSAGSISNALLQAYVKLYCPDIMPQVLFVPGSDVRAMALQAGELDGTLVEIAELMQLQDAAPGKFPVLINYATAIPNLKTTGIYTSKKYAESHPEIVRDYLRAVLTVYREIQENPAPLYDALVTHAKLNPDTAKKVGDVYIERKIWDVNGGLSQDDVNFSLDFFVQTGSVPAGLDAAKLTDMSFLDAVLQEIGRK